MTPGEPNGSAKLFYVDEIIRLVGQDAGDFRPELDWKRVEREFGVRFPSDYRALMERFPSGCFRESVEVQNPVENAEELAHYRDRNAWQTETYADESNGYLDEVPYRMFPEPGGLFLWGHNDAAGTFWWITDSDDPDTWRVAHCNRDDWWEHPGPMSRVLHEILVSTGVDNLVRWDMSQVPVRFEKYLRI
ncbi:SMI1/KNR4 family protein [Lentzea sp. NPDC055074]